MDNDMRGIRQPNVPSRMLDFSLRFWVAVILTGIASGLGAIAMMTTLHTVQHLAFHYQTGEFSAAVARSTDSRTVFVLVLGGLITGVGLWLIGRYLGGTGGEPTSVVWTHAGRLSLARTLLSGTLSEVTVGLGGSIGREAAPQRIGAASGSYLGRQIGIRQDQSYILIACGAGAGLAAVYNSPLAGALFATELYLGTISLILILPALLTSGIATAVSWLVLPSHAVYLVPQLPHATASLMVFAIVLGPVIGLISAGYVGLIGWASDHRPKKWPLLVEPLVFFAVLGLIAIKYPLVLGNGVDLAQFAFTGHGVLGFFAILAILKVLATTGTLRSGATGGLFTPTLSFGAALGAFLGRAWSILWSGPPDASYAIIVAAAMMASAMEAPATAIVFILELTRNIQGIMVPMLLAVVGATLTARHFNLRSIYSARLNPEQGEPLPQKSAMET
ncbi:chloride channel protein [Sulfobacillus thermosulfidooxidans]|uniref:chloride channel protein n=1 Tax=Sulfobacillus thermosulfidooxidans TaxID=28034 RepID=UPI0006B46CD3|nr:chloride channel protein [Sulfobacillus thermosulfidooxidans]